jgi:release factor glutamine methyltransferase
MSDGPILSVLLANATECLRRAGLNDPRREALALADAVLGLDPAGRVAAPDQPIASSDAALFESAFLRRAAHEPLARIAGRREFWSLDFVLSPDTLVPRPDSETLVEAVLGDVIDHKATLKILDLGTGSGCLLLALLSELPNAVGLGIDCAEGAVRTAQENATRLGLGDRAQFQIGDWCAGLSTHFDIIVANPPYIPDHARMGLAPEVRDHDPPRALFAGVDGLDAFRAIVPALKERLCAGGLAAFECGAEQSGELSEILNSFGFSALDSRRDLGGHIRVLLGRAAGLNPSLTPGKKTVGKGGIPV